MKDKYIVMSDVPLIRTNTLSGVVNWIEKLKERGYMWHMDDDARQVPAFLNPPMAANLFESQRLLALDICRHCCVDLWSIIPKISTLKEFCATRIYESGPTIDDLNLHHTHDCMTQLLVYGHSGEGELYSLTETDLKKLTYLEWIPPADGGCQRFEESYDTDMMRYTGYWTNREWGHAFTPDKLHEAEAWLWNKYRRFKCQR